MPGWGGSVLRAGKARREKSWSPENASAKLLLTDGKHREKRFSSPDCTSGSVVELLQIGWFINLILNIRLGN